jgi:hypothetical protein
MDISGSDLIYWSNLPGGTTAARSLTEGSNLKFAVFLKQKPDSTVDLSVTSSDTSRLTVASSTLTFTASGGSSCPGGGNWCLPKTVTATALNDNYDNGDQTLSVSLQVVTGDSGSYTSGLVPTIQPQFTVLDNDTAGFNISSNSPVTDEGGSTAIFTVKLTSRPYHDVTIALDSLNTAEGTISPTSLIFTPLNWSTNQSVTITGVNDSALDGDQNYVVRLNQATSSDSSYNNLDPSDKTVTNRDDDKYIFVTQGMVSGLIDSNLDGNAITEADAFCTAQRTVVGAPSGSYLALIVDSSNRKASPLTYWPLKSDYNYYVFGTGNFMGSANSVSRIFNFPLSHSFSSSTSFWTGMESDWTSSTNHCNNWSSDQSLDRANTGDTSSTTMTFINSGIADSCDQMKPILCVQQ